MPQLGEEQKEIWLTPKHYENTLLKHTSTHYILVQHRCIILFPYTLFHFIVGLIFSKSKPLIGSNTCHIGYLLIFQENFNEPAIRLITHEGHYSFLYQPVKLNEVHHVFKQRYIQRWSYYIFEK